MHALLVGSPLGVSYSREEWERYAAWSSWENPFRERRPPGWVGLVDDKIAAFIGAAYVPFRIEGRSTIAASVGCLCVDPSLPSIIATAFTRAHLRDAAVPVQFGAHFARAAGNIWHALGAVELPDTNVTFEALVNPALLWRRRLARLSLPGRLLGLAGAGWLLARLTDGRGPRLHGHLHAVQGVAAAADLPADLDDLCRAAMASVAVGVERTPDYIEWRYLRHPRRESYRFVSTAAGLAVVEMYGPVARICEFLTWDLSESTVDELLAAVAGVAVQQGAIWLITKPLLEELVPLWIDRGFVPRRKEYNQYRIFTQQTDLDVTQGALMFAFGEFKLE